LWKSKREAAAGIAEIAIDRHFLMMPPKELVATCYAPRVNVPEGLNMPKPWEDWHINMGARFSKKNYGAEREWELVAH